MATAAAKAASYGNGTTWSGGGNDAPLVDHLCRERQSAPEPLLQRGAEVHEELPPLGHNVTVLKAAQSVTCGQHIRFVN